MENVQDCKKLDDFSSLHFVFMETLRKPACLGICQK